LGGLSERAEALLGPVLASLDAVTTAAGERASVAGQFVQFRLFATYYLADQIREQLLPTTSPPKQDGGPNPTLDKQDKFALFILVDSFLFESASIRDALLQFANVIFDLKIAEDDTRLIAKLRTQLSITSTTTTGLEVWTEASTAPPWLNWLRTLRDVTTHRRPLRIPTSYRLPLYGPEAGSSRIDIESTDGTFEPLQKFIDRIEEDLISLLKESFDRLGVFHAAWTKRPPL
jgi:hypothetical protein